MITPATAFSTLETPRLRLRHFAQGDLPSLLAYRNDPAVARYQSWDSMSEAEARNFIQEMSTSRPGVPGEWFQFAVEVRAGGAHIGDCALHTRGDDPRLGEVGYSLATPWQGQGYASEALRAVLDFAFSELHMHRIIATVDTRNAPSIALVERLGFRREAHHIQCAWFKGSWCDEYVYALLRADWQPYRA